MSSTPTLDAEYRKVIEARYLDKPCVTCGGKLVEGDFAATNDFTKWDSYCTKCSRSAVNQIAALVQRIETTAAPLGDKVPGFIVQTIATLEPQVADAFAGKLDTQAFASLKKALRDVLQHTINAALPPSTPDLLIDALRAIAASGDRDSAFAGSLVQGFNKYGSLTANQRGAAERMVAARARKAQERLAQALAPIPVPVPVPVVEPGLYRSDDGTIRRVYRTGKGRISCRKYNGRTFQYEGVPGVRIVGDGIAAGTTRLLNAVEASAFGRQAKLCFNCLSIGRPGHLSDDRSLAVGYGETCADHNGWWYPTADEAARILRGDLDLDQKLTQSLTTGAPLPIAPTAEESEEIAEAIETGVPVTPVELDDADVYVDDDDADCPSCGRETGTSNGVVVCDNCGWSADADEGSDEPHPFGTHIGRCDVCEDEDDDSTLVPATPEQIEAFAVFAPLSHEARDAIARSTIASTKSAPDLNLGDVIAQYGCITKLDTTTTPGVVYVWTVGRSTAADVMYNHGDMVRVIEAGVVPQDITVAPAPIKAVGAPLVDTQAPVVAMCVRCEEAPATHSFVCHDGERFAVCQPCRSALVRYHVCPFHAE